MLDRLDWQRDGLDWPNRASSRFVEAGGMRWHVQIAGDGPVLLLVHGTGAATHSWRDLLPLLARHFRVIAPDLPGHGFSAPTRGDGMSLPGMSRLLGQLMDALGAVPTCAGGHSAGAAILARMALDRHIAPAAIASLNGAFLPFRGVWRAFSPAAKFLASTTLAARFAAGRARDRSAVDRLLASTGSALDPRGVDLYARLIRNPGHVAGALAMMANWDLDALLRDLPRLASPLLLLVGSGDRTVPAVQARDVAAIVKRARVETLSDLGHLAHEECPGLVAEHLLDFWHDSRRSAGQGGRSA